MANVTVAVAVYRVDLPPIAILVPPQGFNLGPESGMLAQRLLAKGFTKVTVLDEGLGVWRLRKYGTQSTLAP